MNRAIDQAQEAIARDGATLNSLNASTVSRVVAGVAVLHHQAVIGREMGAQAHQAETVLFYAERQRRLAEVIRLLSEL